MSYLTFDDLTARTFSSSTVLNESITTRTFTEIEVFLSYRRKDKSWVDGVVRFLRKLQVSVYIDYLDQTLEDQSSEEIAKRLRDRIQRCSKFISLVTPDSGNSKWMPWELGLGDRIHNYANVTLLPLTYNANTWNDQEYGKIYARIENIPSVGFSNSDTWYVIFPNGSKINLRTWLAR